MRSSKQPAAAAPAETEEQDVEKRGDAGHKHPEPVVAPKVKATKPQKGAYGARVRPQK